MGKVVRINIAVIDDHPIVRQGLLAVLGAEVQFNIVAEGSSARDAVEIARRLRPHIVVLDLNIPGNGIEALKQISANFPDVRCLILTVCDRAETAMSALDAGAKGYVLKGVSAPELKRAIWTIVNNESFVSPEFAAKLLMSKVPRNDQLGEPLSFRESQVIDEVERGLTNRQIAIKLQISEKTVKYYMSRLMQKLEVSNRVSAVVASQKLRSGKDSLSAAE